MSALDEECQGRMGETRDKRVFQNLEFSVRIREWHVEAGKEIGSLHQRLPRCFKDLRLYPAGREDHPLDLLVMQSKDLATSLPGFASWLCHLGKLFIPFCLSSLICEMGVIIGLTSVVKSSFM